MVLFRNSTDTIRVIDVLEEFFFFLGSQDRYVTYTLLFIYINEIEIEMGVWKMLKL